MHARHGYAVDRLTELSDCAKLYDRRVCRARVRHGIGADLMRRQHFSHVQVFAYFDLSDCAVAELAGHDTQ